MRESSRRSSGGLKYEPFIPIGMVKILVGYYSRSGNTKAMAEAVAEGARSKGAGVDLKAVGDIDVDSLPGYDAIVFGSPTYYGVMAAEMKDLIDRSVKHHGDLEGKVGGAFSSSGLIGGGNETTILSILQAFLIHGMVVPGVAQENHYGPVSVGMPDEDGKAECMSYGVKIAHLAKKTTE